MANENNVKGGIWGSIVGNTQPNTPTAHNTGLDFNDDDEIFNPSSSSKASGVELLEEEDDILGFALPEGVSFTPSAKDEEEDEILDFDLPTGVDFNKTAKEKENKELKETKDVAAAIQAAMKQVNPLPRFEPQNQESKIEEEKTDKIVPENNILDNTEEVFVPKNVKKPVKNQNVKTEPKRKINHVFVDVQGYNSGQPITLTALAISKKLNNNGLKYLKERAKELYTEYQNVNIHDEESYSKFLKHFFEGMKELQDHGFFKTIQLSAYGNKNNKGLEEMCEKLSTSLDKYYLNSKSNKNYIVITRNQKESKLFARYKRITTRENDGTIVRRKYKKKDSLRYIFRKNFKNVRFGNNPKPKNGVPAGNISYIAWAAELYNMAYSRVIRATFGDSSTDNGLKAGPGLTLYTAAVRYIGVQGDNPDVINLGTKYAN